MKIYKFCKRQHNIALGCDTIRIANMTYYLNFEDPDIGDDQEGAKVVYKPFSTQIEQIRHTYMTRFNLIFCASLENIGSLSEYDSCYTITDIESFAHIIGTGLMDVMTLNDLDYVFDQDDIVTLESASKINVRFIGNDVSYVERSKITDIHLSSDNIPFWKDVAYQHQKEYRLLFQFGREDRPASFANSSVHKEYFDINIRKYKEFIPVKLVY